MRFDHGGHFRKYLRGLVAIVGGGIALAARLGLGSTKVAKCERSGERSFSVLAAERKYSGPHRPLALGILAVDFSNDCDLPWPLFERSTGMAAGGDLQRANERENAIGARQPWYFPFRDGTRHVRACMAEQIDHVFRDFAWPFHRPCADSALAHFSLSLRYL